MRLLLRVCVFSSGIAAAIAWQLPVGTWPVLALSALAFAITATVLSRAGARFVLGFLLFPACAGLAIGVRAAGARAATPELARVVDADLEVDLAGVVLSAPELAPNGNGCRLRVRLTRAGAEHASLVVALSIATGVPDVMPGDVVRFRARPRSVRGTANPGVPDPTLQARAAGIDLFAGVGRASAIEIVSGPSRASVGVLRAAAAARRALAAALDGEVSGPARELLHTAVLGERRQADPRIEDGFRAAGATHVLSVSGLHLAVIGVALFAGIRALVSCVPRLPLVVRPAAVAALATIPAIWFYAAITGGAVATLRAAWMMSMVLAARVAGRTSEPVVAIAIASLVLLLQSPLVIFDVSFQLSVSSVLALAVLVAGRAPGTARPAPRGLRRALHTAGRWLARLLFASLTAGLITAPLVAHHFGELTPAGPLGNLLLVPLVESGVVPLGLAGAALAATLGAWAGHWPLELAAAAARLVLFIAEGFRRSAPVVLTRMPDALETAALMAAAGCFIHGLPRARAHRGVLHVTAIACLGLGLGSVAIRELARRNRRELVVTFLDVGQGDAAVVELPGGSAWLIDGGGTYDGSFDPGARIVEPFLRRRGILRLDVVALSHPHPDHMGGLHRILQRFDVGALWTSGDDGRNPDYHRLIAEARERQIATPVPARVREDGVSIEPLGPFVATAGGGGDRIGPPEGTTVNDASLILRVSNGRRAVLFTGDLEAPGEGELCGRASLGQEIASEILKVPHHGSRTSSSDELLDAARPRLAVMSLGWHNRFHFPRPEILARYRQRGIGVLRTDLDGAVTVTLTPGGGIELRCARECS